MRAKIQKTYTPSAKDIQRKWYIVDAQGKTLGRLASKIVTYLTGKNKPTYAPNLDMGDYVIVINAKHIHVTGKRLTDKIYYRHTGYPGGIYDQTLREMLARSPERPLRLAVKRMLPKKALGHQILGKLKIYEGKEHPHAAQQPEALVL